MDEKFPAEYHSTPVKPGYEKLVEILMEAYEQAATGKGHERHASNLPFDEQPMQTISALLATERGMAFQAIKKLREALDLPDPDRQVAELLGAINYIAGIVLYLRRRENERADSDRAHMAMRLASLSPTERGSACQPCVRR